jgi:hypothetical protein
VIALHGELEYPKAAARPQRQALADRAEEPLHIIALAGHYHFRGFRFEAYRVHADGSLGEQLYDYQSFDEPDFRQFDGSLVLHAGEGIEWRCTYQNDTTRTFTFGQDAALEEHCILSGFYYPTNAPQEAIRCVHDRDATGNDVTQRVVTE